jgi:hypothetical protein
MGDATPLLLSWPFQGPQEFLAELFFDLHGPPLVPQACRKDIRWQQIVGSQQPDEIPMFGLKQL